jgi:hypothetical protein
VIYVPEFRTKIVSLSRAKAANIGFNTLTGILAHCDGEIFELLANLSIIICGFLNTIQSKSLTGRMLHSESIAIAEILSPIDISCFI